jgi:sialic acid synthase SpsE
MNTAKICGREIGPSFPPFVIAEIGINHEGSIEKAKQMIDDAVGAGCECVKFQSHVIDDEMIPNSVVPGNASESIWDIMKRCSLTEDQEAYLKEYAEGKGLIYLCTPFSRAAAYRQERLGIAAYKIGSGECNNYPLIKIISSFGKPVILSTGMNDIESIRTSYEIVRRANLPCILLHCTSIYPTPYRLVRLGALGELGRAFDTALIGLSDHSLGNYTAFGAVALGACVIEKHFTSSKTWPGPDIPISLDPAELRDLIQGVRAIHDALGGVKAALPEEQPTIDFAYACVVTLCDIKRGEALSSDNIWVKRPGTGSILAKHYDSLLGKIANRDLPKNYPLSWSDFS